MAKVELLPQAWKDTVIPILRRGSVSEIEWSLRAAQDWELFGMRFEAHDRLAKLISTPGLLAERIEGMIGADEITPCSVRIRSVLKNPSMPNLASKTIGSRLRFFHFTSTIPATSNVLLKNLKT